MKMSVREARSNFATALDAAQRGESVIITKNGKPVAELGPPKAKVGFDWARNEQVRKALGLDQATGHPLESDGSIPFTGPAWTHEVWGDYFAKLDREFETE